MTENLHRLIDIMARLRDPRTGCPWDIEQTFATIAPYTIEEAYEVADAIARDDMADLRDELGDLLLQVVFHARMAEEQHDFTFDDVAAAIADKLVRRHPHVFEADADTPDLRVTWENQKAAERAAKAEQRGHPGGILDDVPLPLPALTRAEKLQKRAARVGFDWSDPLAVLAKVEEEIAELRTEIENDDTQRAAAELGDLLFALVNLGRHLDAGPEAALRATNEKFTRRFRYIEQHLAAAGRPLDANNERQPNLSELEALWQDAKSKESVKD